VEEGENTREIVQRVHEDNSVLEVGLGRGIYIVARSMARKLCCEHFHTDQTERQRANDALWIEAQQGYRNAW